MASLTPLSCLTVLMTVASSSPLAQPSSSSSPSHHQRSRHASSTSEGSSHHSPSASPQHKTCSPVEVTKCSTFYTSAQMPNVFGEFSQHHASESLRAVLAKLGSTNKLVTSFMCSLFIPPCLSASQLKVKSTLFPLHCQKTCGEAMRQSRGSLPSDPSLESWPVRCNALPSDNCFAFDGE